MIANIGEEVSQRASISEFNPDPSITWEHGGGAPLPERLITNTPLITVMPTVQSILHLSAVCPEDSGTYTITATNDAGSNEETFNLTVKGMAIILLFMECSN